jgi:hypothetical protein
MSYKCGVNFLILKTNYFWSNRGIVCLIISVLGSTHTQNILQEKKVWSDRVNFFRVECFFFVCLEPSTETIRQTMP